LSRHKYISHISKTDAKISLGTKIHEDKRK